jgi:hypothetical protein
MTVPKAGLLVVMATVARVRAGAGCFGSRLTIRLRGEGIRRLGRIGKTLFRKAKTAFRNSVFTGSPLCSPQAGSRNRLRRQARCGSALAGPRWPVLL